MNIPYYFDDGNLKNGCKITQESQNFPHANSLPNVIPNFPDLVLKQHILINKLFTLD